MKIFCVQERNYTNINEVVYESNHCFIDNEEILLNVVPYFEF